MSTSTRAFAGVTSPRRALLVSAARERREWAKLAERRRRMMISERERGFNEWKLLAAAVAALGTMVGVLL